MLYFTDRRSPSLLFKGLSVAFKDDLNFGVVKDKGLMSKFDLTRGPAVIGLTDPSDYEGVFYDKPNDLQYEEFKRFLVNF